MANTQAVDPSQSSVLPGASSSIFEHVFDMYGTLDRAGNIVEMHGRIFEKTTADPQMLVGQPFPDTVFWQSAENTPRFIDRAIKNAGGGTPERILVDFRISADERAAMELFVQEISGADGQPVLFFCGKRAAPETRSNNP